MAETTATILRYETQDVADVLETDGLDVTVECGHCGEIHEYTLNEPPAFEIDTNTFDLQCLNSYATVKEEMDTMVFKVVEFEGHVWQDDKEILRYKWDGENETGSVEVVNTNARRGVPPGDDNPVASAVDHMTEKTTLSEREAEAVTLHSWNVPRREIAEAMEIKESTVNEYLKRAKDKAKDGRDTYNALVDAGLVD